MPTDLSRFGGGSSSPGMASHPVPISGGRTLLLDHMGNVTAQDNGDGTGATYNKPKSLADQLKSLGATIEANPVGHAVMQGGRNLASGTQWVGNQPLVRGTLTALDSVGRGVRAGLTGNNPIGGVFDPEGDEKRTESLVDKVAPVWNSVARGTMGLPTADKGSFGRSVLKFGVQTATDPTTYVPGLDAFSIAGRAAKALKATGKIQKVVDATAAGAKAAGNAVPGPLKAAGSAISRNIVQPAQNFVSAPFGGDIVENLKSSLGTSHNALKSQTQSGLNITRAREAGANVLQNARNAEYDSHMSDFADRLPQLENEMRLLPVTEMQKVDGEQVARPIQRIGANSTDMRSPTVRAQLSPDAQKTLSDVNSATDKVSWRLGSTRVRRQMLASGFTPSADEAALPVLNVLDKYHGAGYLPEKEAFDPSTNDAAKAARQYTVTAGGVSKSTYNQAKNNAFATSPLTDRLSQYFNSAAYLEPKRAKELSLLDNFGLKPTQQARTQARLGTASQNAEDNIAQHVFDKTDAAPNAALSDVSLVKANTNLDRVDKYKSLLAQQDAQTAENAQRREAFLNPNAPTKDVALPGIFRSEGDMNAAAGRDVKAAGNDISPLMTQRRAAPLTLPEIVSNGTLKPPAFSDAPGLLDPRTAFDKFGDVRSPVSTTTDKTLLNKQQAVFSAIDSARSKAAKAQGVSQARRSTLADDLFADSSKAIGAGQANLKAAAEKNYDAGIKSDAALTKKIQNTPGLSNQISVGYGRSGSGIVDPGFKNELQNVVNSRGQSMRAAIDPAFNALLNATKRGSIERPFQDIANSVAGTVSDIRRNRGSITAPGEQLVKGLDKYTAGQSNKINDTLQRIQGKNDVNASIGAVRDAAKNDTLHAGAIENMPEGFHDRLFGPQVHDTSLNPAEGLGHLAANVMYSQPLPHMWNVGQQTIFAGGKQGGLRTAIAGVGRSIRAAQGDANTIAEREEARNVGAIPAHGYDTGEPATNIASRVYQGGQKLLTNFHEGQATELFQRDKRAGLTPEDAAAQSHGTYGNPMEQSLLVQKLRKAGLPFANWVLSTVPRAAVKAASSPESRNRLKTYARGIDAANTEYLEPNYGVDFHPGGFAERAATMAFAPAKYLAGKSMQNSIQSAADDSKESLAEFASRFIPYGSLSELATQPLSDKARMQRGAQELPFALRLPSLLGSYYTRSETPRDQMLRERARLGVGRR